MLERAAQLAVRTFCRAIAGWRLTVTVEGRRNVPSSGPVLLACRHFHNLFDGCVLIATLPRTVHLLVALDWVQGGRMRRFMEWACRTVEWPVVLRGDALAPAADRARGAHSAYAASEAGRYIRQGVRDAVSLLQRGAMLAVFPEAYPNVDPGYTPKAGDDAFLPFRSGFALLVERAQRQRESIPIVPVGFSYRHGGRWDVTVRFGAPLYPGSRQDRDALIRRVEEQVRLLSAATGTPSSRVAGKPRNATGP